MEGLLLLLGALGVSLFKEKNRCVDSNIIDYDVFYDCQSSKESGSEVGSESFFHISVLRPCFMCEPHTKHD